MTVGNHIAEIFRQGILASLTGGCCFYEPSNTMFQNTAHMYIWLILLIVPLLLGMFTAGTLSWIPIAGYCGFIFLLFLVLKVSVTYLHQVFDKTEPVVAFKSKKTATTETFRSPVSSFSTTRRETTSNMDGGQMIEMNEFGNLARASRKNTEDEEEENINADRAGCARSDDEQSNSSQYSAASGDSSANELLSKATPKTVLPADSLELISESYKAARRTSDCESGRQTRARRKYSFPNLKENMSDHRSGRLQIRKVRSTSDTTWPRQLAANPHLNLVHSDYVLLNELTNAVKTDEAREPQPSNVVTTKAEIPNDVEDQEEIDEPCCSKSLSQPNDKSDDYDLQRQVVKRTAQKFPAAVLHRTLDRLGAENLPELDACAVGDLKGHITKFLEELIEKHPETLDAIENIRMNRLGRPTTFNTNNSDSLSSRNDIDGRERLDGEPKNPSLYNLGLQDGTHVAYDHEDTTQGAIHSFQDEKGNWWTYAFDEQSNGTAKALGSSRAIFEMFDRRRSLVSNSSESRSSQVTAINADIHSKGRHQHSLRHARHSNRNRLSEDHGRISATLHGKHQKSLPTVPSNSLLDTQSLDHQSMSAHPSSHAASENNSITSEHKAQSEDSDSDKNYILSTPTSVFHPSGQITSHHAVEAARPGDSRHAEPIETGSSRPFISFVNLASRLYTNQLQRNAGRSRLSSVPLAGEYSRDLHPAASLIDTSSQPMSRQSRMALESFALESRRRIQTNPDTERFRWHDYIRMENTGLRPRGNNTSPFADASDFIEELQFYSQQRQRSVRQTQSKINYYYRLKLLPKWIPIGKPQGIKIKLNRLALTALFDRNNSWFSIVFDVWLALLVTIMASVLIARGIFTDFSLFVFAFVVAGSQFSLLKSVQPDAASPIHGFNWLVCYSRPAYFCLLALLTFFLDYKLGQMNSIYASPTTLSQIGFVWNPHTEKKTVTFENFVVGLRDLSALSILLLPVFFTIGLLPMINTLLMHTLEQIEMHFFGGTAAFSLLSSIICVSRSAIVVGLLCVLGHFAYYMDEQSTQNVMFSAFVAILLSAAFIMSRWSSNPMFLRMFFDLLPWWRHSESCVLRSASTTNATETKQSEPRVAYRTKASEAGSNIVLELGNTLPNKKQPTKKTSGMKKNESAQNVSEIMAGGNIEDPLPQLLRKTLSLRIQHDFFYVIINTLLLFALHSTSVFTVVQPYFELICISLCFLFGLANHHIYPQLRAHNPWKFFARPILRPYEFNQFETTVQAKLMAFERIHIWMLVVEKTILYPLLIANLLTKYAWIMPFASIPLTTLAAFRLARSAYANPQMLFVPLGSMFLISRLAFNDFGLTAKVHPAPAAYPFSYFGLENPSPLLVFYCSTMLWPKVQEFIHKLNFILIYLAPWQIAWGSAFHAFAQPFSVPHTGLIAAQALFSSIISAPLNPFLGSSIFFMSYVRPLRFWEKNYNTGRVDNSNLRLVSQLDKGPLIDDSSLNSIFYEHLTRSLQQSLAGDLALGRWGCPVEPGDCFVLVSLYLSCLIQIIEVGNGFITFQMRGLEFRGTYCHQREAEAISEDLLDNGGFCCCSVGPIPGLLSFNNNWALRSQAWHVTTSKYIIDGYSITDNSAVNLLQVHELRRLLVTFYVKCIIYYSLKSNTLEGWLQNEIILQALEPIRKKHNYMDSDQLFCAANDEDYDPRKLAITRQRFYDYYGPWISFCLNQRLASESNNLPANTSVTLINSFCFALSILGRRALGAAANGGMTGTSYNRNVNAAESFLYGLHALFKGDMRVGSPADEWVFADPGILTTVISPAVRVALKLHQDHFAVVDDFEELDSLYERIQRYQTSIFISHEHDPAWRQAIIANTPSLLALRHMYDESQDDYKVIMLNKMHLNMRVIKLNRECVRAFWAGQQQELIFLRNRNPERGSIQNARQVLRNMINSSQVELITGRPITFFSILTKARRLLTQLRQHFGTSNSSNMAGLSNAENPMPVPHHSIGPTVSQAGATPLPNPRRRTMTSGATQPIAETLQSDSKEEDNVSHTASLAANSSIFENNGDHRRCKSDVGTISQIKKMLAGTDQNYEQDTLNLEAPKALVEIIDVQMIHLHLNESLKFSNEFLVIWPQESMRMRGGRSVWPASFKPSSGLRGKIVHSWVPFHPKRELRSHSGHIYLIEILHESTPLYIPVLREGVRILDNEHYSYTRETNF